MIRDYMRAALFLFALLFLYAEVSERDARALTTTEESP